METRRVGKRSLECSAGGMCLCSGVVRAWICACSVCPQILCGILDDQVKMMQDVPGRAPLELTALSLTTF
ncbi:hypothetical protein NDU88_002453 [Pleurodeles waltl]|uniref:Uncharacterized protein n=1 Tax=Pleurodeles waltl TaxID=8319 RepID=A0AAV7M2H7_PLEWA|nr:hypothetical protein NDU88_002453 [Pleurodeles waltl]